MNIFKKSLIAIALCGAALCSFAADVKPYVDADALPDALNYYPAPPDTMSPQFMYDISQYMWGKKMRQDSARAALAVAQAAETEPSKRWPQCSVNLSGWKYRQRRRLPL